MSEFATQCWPSTTAWKGTGRPCRATQEVNLRLIVHRWQKQDDPQIHLWVWHYQPLDSVTLTGEFKDNREFEDYHRQARKTRKRGNSLWHWSPRQLSPEVCGNSFAKFEYVLRDHLFSLLLRYKNPVIIHLVVWKMISYESLSSTPIICLWEADNLFSIYEKILQDHLSITRNWNQNMNIIRSTASPGLILNFNRTKMSQQIRKSINLSAELIKE